MRRAHKLCTWLQTGGAGEVAGLRQQVLSRQLSCKRLATIATDSLHSVAQQWPSQNPLAVQAGQSTIDQQGGANKPPPWLTQSHHDREPGPQAAAAPKHELA